mmetsp:Transcript_79614/g.234140  ORF Transcript_79614/g.234140 Transcript_79614/m.234140 type:complete len:774 (-) Transcript_79614:334-2655(-)
MAQRNATGGRASASLDTLDTTLMYEVEPAVPPGSTALTSPLPRPHLGAGSGDVAALPRSAPWSKGGYLYARVLEAGNLDALESPGSYGSLCCQPQTPWMLRVSFSCTSIERTVSTTGPARVDPVLQTAVFEEELLMRSLNFCSADRLSIVLLSKSRPIGEASVPLRAALPEPLAHTTSWRSSSVEPITREAWLPRQHLTLRPHGSGGSPPTAALEHDEQPYLELQLLQLVDCSLPRLAGGVHPLLLAVADQQEQLVRAYLSLNVADSLPAQDQAQCISMAIDQRAHSILVQLLDQMQPSHQHLLAALRIRSVDLVEALLQAGGAALLNPSPLPNIRTGGRSSLRRPPHHEVGAEPSPLPRDAREGPLAPPPLAELEARRPAVRPLTPLAVACSLGDVAMVEALCQWAKRERVQLDPTAPLTLGGEVPSPNGTIGLWDRDMFPRDGDGESSACFGDPPMVMAVRSKASLSSKLLLIKTLARYGFSADIRSPVDSWTPLLAAVELGSLELVTILVRLSARLSADRHLGFTPLHLACQVAHWHLVPVLAEAMQRQHGRVAAWGPSPQYVSMNLVDAYGRTALDIALIHYFSNPLPCWSERPTGSGSEQQKAVDILREFLHRSPPKDAGVVCGWELLHVLRFLDTMPSRKAVGAQLWDPDWDNIPGLAGAPKQECLPGDAMEKPRIKAVPYSDMEELLQAVRVLVRSGARTQWLPQDLVWSSSRGLGCAGAANHGPSGEIKEAITGFGSTLCRERSVRYSPIDPEDFEAASADEGPH